MKIKQHEWYQGIYNIINKKKYIGYKEPIFRSSWEKRLMTWLDTNDNVIKWGNEIIKIPYMFDYDRKIHNYITDFYCEVIDKETKKIKKYLIEIKPKKELSIPKKPKINNAKAMRNYAYSVRTYVQNKNKWMAAEAFCKRNNIEWKILTEKDLL